MQPSTVITFLAAATLAAAMPSKPYTGTTVAGGTANSCGQDQKLSCCNSAGLAVLGAECGLLDVLGGNCNGNVQCCDVTQSGAINLVNLCVPISL